MTGPASKTVHAGRGTLLARTLAGHVLSASPGHRATHPWQTLPTWSPATGIWRATVAPGFVNAAAPIYRAIVPGSASMDADYGINPLTGQPFFSADVFTHDKTVTPDSHLDIPLYLNPSIPLSFRRIGWDGLPGTPVPRFFLERGAAAYPRQQTRDIDAGFQTPERPRGLRLLRAADLILHKPRAGITSTISLEPGLLTGSSIVTQTLGLRFAPPIDRLRVLTGTFSAGPTQDPLIGDYEEPTWDELLISTVYLLSPVGTPPGSDPDASWEPFVQHSLFWNLFHRTPAFRLSPRDSVVPFIPPLAGGAAQLVFNFLTASLNDLIEQTLTRLRNHSMAGTFWTATGGGHDAVFPPEPEPAQATGLDKAARLHARRTAAAAARRELRLDPVFPYRALPFDPAILTAA